MCSAGHPSIEEHELGYPLLGLALLLAVFTVANVAFAERPEDCAPEDREIPGNTNLPCKWDYHLNEITSVSYGVAENIEGNICHEVLVFGPYNGGWDSTPKAFVQMWMEQKNEQGALGATWGNIARQLVGEPGNSITVIPGVPPPNGRGVSFYSVESSVPERSGWGTYYAGARHGVVYRYQDDYHFLKISISQSENQGNEVHGINAESRWLPMPTNIADFNLLMNDCLAGIKQRLENEAKLEETRQKVEAERVAQERAAKQADAEPERQRLETEAAREALRIAR